MRIDSRSFPAWSPPSRARVCCNCSPSRQTSPSRGDDLHCRRPRDKVIHRSTARTLPDSGFFASPTVSCRPRLPPGLAWPLLAAPRASTICRSRRLEAMGKHSSAMAPPAWLLPAVDGYGPPFVPLCLRVAEDVLACCCLSVPSQLCRLQPRRWLGLLGYAFFGLS